MILDNLSKLYDNFRIVMSLPAFHGMVLYVENPTEI